MGGCLERVEAGAAAVGFVEGGAEVAEAVVADFESSFGDVAFAGAKKFGGAFHAELAKVLLNGHAAFLAEKAAEIKPAATDLFAEGFESGRFGEVFAKDLAGAFDAFAGGALGACAEEFAAGGLKEEMGSKFKSLAAEPDFARRLKDRALLKALDELQVKGAEAFGSGDVGLRRTV